MIRTLLATTLALTAAMPAFADDVRSVEIEYNVRDLTHPDGLRDIEARIADAAERVCDMDTRRLEAQRAERRCREAAMESALAQLHSRADAPAGETTAVKVSKN